MAVEKEQSGSSLSGGIMIANKCHRCQTRFFFNQLCHLQHCHCLKMAPGRLKLVSENIISSQLSLPLRVCLISKLVLMTRPVKWQCLILITRYKEIFIISIICMFLLKFKLITFIYKFNNRTSIRIQHQVTSSYFNPNSVGGWFCPLFFQMASHW